MMRSSDEPETMRELRAIRKKLSEEISKMTVEEEIKMAHSAAKRFEKETGIALPRLQKSIK